MVAITWLASKPVPHHAAMTDNLGPELLEGGSAIKGF